MSINGKKLSLKEIFKYEVKTRRNQDEKKPDDKVGRRVREKGSEVTNEKRDFRSEVTTLWRLLT